ncbi:MAG: ROK family protein, partial [Pseudomonadota bacterium]|nr:ROK family protein [Pseudomonadota bacterium]
MTRNLKNSSSAAGAKSDRSRGRNRQAVLSEIRAAGQIGRAAIARSLGLSTQAVSNIIADLEADGLLVERGMHSAGRGLPAMQYGLNPTGGFALGIEVRPDALFLALLDLEGQPVSTRRKALVDHAPETVVAEVTSLLKQTLAKSDVVAERIIGAGVVLPGPFGQTGLSGKGPVLIGWQDIDAADLFASALDLPVEVSNDANAAAMAER